MLAPTQEPVGMNRAARRAQAKSSARRPTSRPRARFESSAEAYRHLLKPMQLLSDCRPYESGELITDLIRIQDAFIAIKQGSASEEEFNRVAVAINLAKIRALDIDATLADMIERGQDAMARCRKRYVDHGRFGFDGPGLSEVCNALDAHEEILRNSSPKQMVDAMSVMARVLKRQIALTGHQEMILAP